MAITNNQIVAAAWLELVAAGAISENETIHTFDYWRDYWRKCGYTVKRGEKAITALMIWKHSTKTITHDDGSTEEAGRLFMKKAYFFSTNQVEKIQPIKRVSAAEMIGRPQTIQINRKKRKIQTTKSRV